MKYLIIIFASIISSSCLAQKSVYYYRDTGFDTLTIHADNRFEQAGGVGLAQSIITQGVIIQMGDTLLLEQTSPTMLTNMTQSI